MVVIGAGFSGRIVDGQRIAALANKQSREEEAIMAIIGGGAAGRKLAFLTAFLLAFGLLLSCQSQPAAPAAATQAPAAPTKAPAAPAAPTQPSAAAVQPTQAPAAVASETIKVGIATALSGPASPVGITMDRFLRLAMDDIQAKGGIRVGGKTYRFEAVTVDDKASSEGGRDAANALILRDKVKFIFGFTGNAPLITAQTLSEPSKVLIATGASAENRGGSKFPLTFDLATIPTGFRAATLIDWLKEEHPNAKNLALVQSDDAAGHDQVDAVAAAVQANGLNVIAKEFYPPDLQNFDALAIRVLRQKPDAIYSNGGNFSQQLLGLMQTIHNQGFKGPVFGFSVDASLALKGAAFMEGFTYLSLADWKAPVVATGERAMIDRYIQKHGEANFSTVTSPVYNMPLVVAQAMEKAGTVEDTEKIAQTLRQGEWDTMWTKELGKSRLSGEKTYGLPSVLEVGMYFSQVKAGKLTTTKLVKAAVP